MKKQTKVKKTTKELKMSEINLHEFANYQGLEIFEAIKVFEKYKDLRNIKSFLKMVQEKKFQHPEGVKRILINKGYLKEKDE